MLKPLGDRVVLKVEEKEQTVGGFEGVRTLSGELIAPAVKAGDQVLVESHAGIEVKDGEETYTIVGTSNILAIVE